MYKGVFSVIVFTALSSLIFVSCGTDSPVAPTTTEVTVQITDANIKHTYITDFYPNKSFYNDNDFAAVAWRSDTVNYIGRTLFRFNLSLIPQNATITNAHFDLNYDQAPFHYTGAGHHQDSGSNASYFQRITQNWVDTSVNWSNQPTITQVNQITLDSSITNFQNYSVDMTAAISDIYKNPNLNFGFLFRLKTESPLRVLGFSAGNENRNLKPILQVTYTTTK